MGKPLPDITDLGATPRVTGERPIGAPDATAYAKGVQALGEGISKLGMGAANYLVDKSRYEEAQADSDFLTRKIELDSSLKHDTDYTTLNQRYTDNLSKILNDAAGKIEDPQARQRFMVSSAPKFAQGVAGADEHAFKTEAGTQVAYVQQQGDKFISQATEAGQNPETRADIIQKHGNLIDGLARAGYINPVQARDMRQKWAQQFVIADINTRIDTDPAAVVNELRQAPGSPQQIDTRTIQIESGNNPNARNSASDAVGLGQFVQKTWLPLIKQLHPELASTMSDQQLLDLRRDPTLSKELTGALRERNWQTLADAGIQPNAGNAYLSHFLGAGDAIKVLRADPNTPVESLLSPQVIASNRSILAGKTAGTVAQWADNLMGGVGAQGGHIYDILRPDQREVLLQKAQTKLMRNQTAAESQDAAQTFQIKSLVDDDLSSMRDTGQGVENIDPQVIRNTLGEPAYVNWKQERDFNHATWAATHDMPLMSNDELEKRLGDLAPKPGQQGYALQQKIFETASKRANELLATRRSDPAGSVEADPGVQQAREDLQKTPDDQAAVKKLVQARLAAQDHAGVPEELRSPITKDEALQMTAPLSRALPGQERDVLKSIAQNFRERYGDYAQDAMEYALRVSKMDKDTARIASRIVRKINENDVPDPADLANADRAKELGAADKALAAGTGQRSAVDLLAETSGIQAQPSAPREPGPIVPPARAIAILRQNPALAGDFDKKYGAGSAKKILDQYRIGPGATQNNAGP